MAKLEIRYRGRIDNVDKYEFIKVSTRLQHDHE